MSSLILIFTFTSNLFAGSIFVLPGARAMGMGGAFVAVADDATAIYWNPAGLTQQENAGLEIATFYVDSSATASQSLPNDPIIYNTEPAQFNSKTLDLYSFLPFIGGYKRVNDSTVIGYGAYVTAGGGGKWEDKVKGLEITDPDDGYIDGREDDVYSKIDGSYGIMVFNVSGAKTLSDKLSLGVCVNILYMEDEQKVVKSYTVNEEDSVLSDYYVQVDQKLTGYGYEAMAGLLYKVNDELDLGMVFRTGATVSLKGKANSIDYSTDVSGDFRMPMTLGVGASYS